MCASRLSRHRSLPTSRFLTCADVFIGRVFIAGKIYFALKKNSGQTSAATMASFVVPSGQPEDSMFRYGFNAVGTDVSLLMVFVVYGRCFRAGGYDYSGNGFGMELLVWSARPRFPAGG